MEASQDREKEPPKPPSPPPTPDRPAVDITPDPLISQLIERGDELFHDEPDEEATR
jgi:hypothetical protein